MPVPFRDITLHLNTGSMPGTTEYWEENCTMNYISDLYCRCMGNYKPPGCSRVTIQPHYHNTWKHTWKTGSVIAIAPAFNAEKFKDLDKIGKYCYLLNMIQECMLQLSEAYHWDALVFEKAYAMVLDKKFIFDFSYPPVLSKNRKLSAFISIEKNELVSSVYATIHTGETLVKAKLYSKTNSFWYDCSYILTRHARWFDADRFGIDYPKGNISVWYSLTDKITQSFQNDLPVQQIDFKQIFWMQLD